MSRALGQTSDRADIEADEDPLVELARIVSEDGAFSGPKPEKPKMNRVEAGNRDALADGLEAELLQELESSFPVREAPAPVRAPIARQSTPPAATRPAAVSTRPAPVQEDPDPDELLRSIEEQLSQFERRQAGRFAAPSSSFESDSREAELPANFSAPVEEPPEAVLDAAETVAEPREEWQSRRASRIRPFAESDAASEGAEVLPPEPVFEEPPVRPAARSEYRFRGLASADWDRENATREEDTEPGRSEYRPQQEPARLREEPPEPAPLEQEVPLSEAKNGSRGGSSSSEALRQERLAAVFPEFDDPPEVAERPAPDLTGLEAGLSRELEPRYADASPGDKWQDGDAPADEPRGAAAIAPGPSRRAAAARAAQQRGRSRFGLLTAAAVILVVVIGAGGAYYLRSSEGTSSGPPPVITADEGAVRVDAAPEQAQAEGETVGEAVYNRVAGAAPSTEEQVVENAEEPREIARIVLPASQSDAEEPLVRPVGGDDATAEAAPPAASGEDEIGPRRVPTFVVRADGTIVATSEAGGAAPDPAAAQAQQLTTETEPIEPVPVPTVSIADTGAPAGSAGDQSQPVPVPPPAAVDDLVPRPTIDEPTAEVAAVEPTEAAPTTAEPADASAPTGIAAIDPSPSPTPPPTADASGGFLVQLSSEGSMADAQSAYSKAQQRFPTVLGSLAPQIQEADLGAKGIFFRVRVGPWATRKEAVDVCEALKTAGGNCFVAR